MAKLTTTKRKKLPKSDFAIPAKKTSKNKTGKGGYPINDPAHARNALARVSQFGTPTQKKAVKSKVAKKFPGIAVKGKKKK